MTDFGVAKGAISLLAGAALTFAIGLGHASATTTGPNFCLNSTGTDCQVQLDLGNGGLNPPYTGPYVHGDVSIVNSKELQFTFTSDTQTISSSTYKYLFNNLAFDLGPSDDLTGISAVTLVSGTYGSTGGAVAAGDVTFGAGLKEDGFAKGGGDFGNFSVSVGTDKGYPSALSSLTFDVTWGAGSTVDWTDLLTQQFMDLSEDGGNCQGNGCSAAGHIYVALVGAGGSLSNTGTTGYAGWPDACDQGLGPCGPTPVPEPASLALLGSGLVGLGLWRRRASKHRPKAASLS